MGEDVEVLPLDLLLVLEVDLVVPVDEVWGYYGFEFPCLLHTLCCDNTGHEVGQRVEGIGTGFEDVS